MALSKRAMPSFQDIHYVLLDIEGTVLPISFVKDVLFVYARETVGNFIKENEAREDVQQAIKSIEDFSKENKDSPPVVRADRLSVVENVLWQMDRDLKTPGLKMLQGLIWRKGFTEKVFTGQLYCDVHSALQKWHDAGIKIGIYSSGSISAQRLLFEHTDKGSLLNIIDSFHDLTTAGSKLDSTSYVAIAKSLNCSPKSILFLTDVYGELKASRDAGMNAVAVVRQGNKPLTESERQSGPLVTSFDEIVLS